MLAKKEFAIRVEIYKCSAAVSSVSINYMDAASQARLLTPAVSRCKASYLRY